MRKSSISIADMLVSVQPMSKPASIIFYTNYLFEKRKVEKPIEFGKLGNRELDFMTAASDNTDRVIRDLQSTIKNYRPYGRSILDDTWDFKRLRLMEAVALIRPDPIEGEWRKSIEFGKLGNRELDLDG